ESGFNFQAPISGGSITGNTASNNAIEGFFVNIFGVANTATFSNNISSQNTTEGYNVISGTPQTGVGTNTGSGNGSNDNF
ncbi:MAG: hypothetical protein QM501_07335, partial [Gimesia sp.]